MNQEIAALLELSHELGREERQLAILGEGNTSARLEGGRFAVKASGARLESLKENDVTICEGAPVLALLDRKTLPDTAVEKALLEARVEATAKKPSIEAVFHAWLLTLEDVKFVGHCHPVAVNQILASPRARDFAEHRMFPDEIVFCGAVSVYVPYADPGLPLAWQIRERTRDFIREHGTVPRLILLQNHGLIALGATAPAVLAAVLMANKAATVFSGAAAMGGPTFLLPQHIDRIVVRPDEAQRQRQLGL
jgi:rhamnose utilization protein RhaD (predicted bifunctional aldolase and dehydrogenase)